MALLGQISLGLYIGVLTGVFTAFFTFLLSFSFRYLAGVTFPSRLSLLLGLGVAGLQGSLYGLLRDPVLLNSPTVLTAVLVLLLVTLYAHKRGKEVGEAVPRLALRRLRPVRLSPEVVRGVGRFGRVRVRVVPPVDDVEGHPPLPTDLRATLAQESWTFPADLPIAELERRVAESLTTAYDLGDVSVAVDARGRATVNAAPPTGGLSRRVPPGTEAVAVDALLPAGLDRGDEVRVDAGPDTFDATVVSARVRPPDPDPALDPGRAEARPEEVRDGDGDGDGDGDSDGVPADSSYGTPTGPDRVGGRGRVALAVDPDDAAALAAHDASRVVATARGSHREYELAALLRRGENRFRRVTLGESSPPVGRTLGELSLRDDRGVAVLAHRRFDSWTFAPDGRRDLRAGDDLFVAGSKTNLDAFRSWLGGRGGEPV